MLTAIFKFHCRKIRRSKNFHALRKFHPQRLRSDVPVGTSLSGGLDSSSIVFLINKLKNKSQVQSTFSARFKNFDKDEGQHIENALKVIRADSHMVWWTRMIFVNDLTNIFQHQEQPFVSASIVAQWKVMECAKNNKIKVLLDGQVPMKR